MILDSFLSGLHSDRKLDFKWILFTFVGRKRFKLINSNCASMLESTLLARGGFGAYEELMMQKEKF